jgi:DNA-binding CsgD family transcriptional regulator
MGGSDRTTAEFFPRAYRPEEREHPPLARSQNLTVSPVSSWREISSQITIDFPWMASLAPAERVVALHIRQGLSTKEIAAALGKSPATVKGQMRSILRKLGAKTHSRLIVRLHENA